MKTLGLMSSMKRTLMMEPPRKTIKTLGLISSMKRILMMIEPQRKTMKTMRTLMSMKSTRWRMMMTGQAQKRAMMNWT